MGGVVPRWEWRTFGTTLRSADRYLAQLEPTEEQESEEIYFLSARGGTVKIRSALMDIKLLREVGVGGLERWEPVFKAEFPLDREQLSIVFDALKEAPPRLRRDEYTQEQLLAEVIEPLRSVRAVPVAKHRTRYTIAGCAGESSEVRIGDVSTRTVAVESEDREAVLAAVRGIGLGSRVNMSYPRGLRAIFDNEPPRYAAIDVGTGSVKFTIGQPTGGGGWQSLVDRTVVTQLGEGLARAGSISAEATDRTADVIRHPVVEARTNLVREIAAVGTAGLRIAGNIDDVLEAIWRRAGVPVEVISGEEESRLAHEAVAGPGLPGYEVMVFHIGAAGSQFSFGRGSRVTERFSVDGGAARFTGEFGLSGVVDSQTLASVRSAMSQSLARLDDRPAPDQVVGVGGAVSSLAAVMLGLTTFDPDTVEGVVLPRAEVQRQIALYSSMGADERRSIVGLQPERAEAIIAGACLVDTVLEKLGQDRLTVSHRGLRHGLIAERFGTGEAEVVAADQG